MHQYLRLLRVYQWIKNLFIFTGLIFAGKLFEFESFLLTLSAFLLFSLIASSVYVINDILDYERDKIHPTKKDRPIASGVISFNTGWNIAITLAFTSLSIALFLNTGLFFILLCYLLLNLIYTKTLKDIVIVDVFCISFGFILRIYSGTVVIDVEASSWLILCTLFVTLFLGFAKRKSELFFHDKSHKSSDYRNVLQYYSHRSIDIYIGISATVTIAFYAFYTVQEETIIFVGSNALIYSVPFVFMGVVRYIHLIYQKHKGDDPTLIAIKDMPIIATILGWFTVVIAVIYC